MQNLFTNAKATLKNLFRPSTVAPAPRALRRRIEPGSEEEQLFTAYFQALFPEISEQRRLRSYLANGMSESEYQYIMTRGERLFLQPDSKERAKVVISSVASKALNTIGDGMSSVVNYNSGKGISKKKSGLI